MEQGDEEILFHGQGAFSDFSGVFCSLHCLQGMKEPIHDVFCLALSTQQRLIGLGYDWPWLVGLRRF